MKMKSESEVAQSLSRVQLLVTPWTAAYQAPLSMGFFQARVLEWVAIAFSAHPPYMFSKENLPVLLPEKTTTKNHAMDSLWSQGRATPMDSLWSQGRATPHHILQAVVAPPVSVEGIQGRHQRDGTYGPHPLKATCIYLFGCTGSRLHHSGSLGCGT